MNHELPMFKLDLKKAEEQEIKLPTSVGSLKKQKSSRKTSASALLTMPKPLTVWITANWKILKEMRIPDHLTCLLRNLYAGQEARVRTGHGTKEWFQIRKIIHQGCILSPCVFNLYAEYIIGEGNGTPLQYSCLENPMDGGAWKAAVHGVAEGRTRLSDFTFTFHFHALEKEMATHSSVLAWRISGMEEPGELPSMGSHRVEHN